MEIEEVVVRGELSRGRGQQREKPHGRVVRPVEENCHTVVGPLMELAGGMHSSGRFAVACSALSAVSAGPGAGAVWNF